MPCGISSQALRDLDYVVRIKHRVHPFLTTPTRSSTHDALVKRFIDENSINLGNKELMASLGAKRWKDVLQLLKEQDEKIARLARALSIIQQGMLRNNPRHVADSVNEATDVLDEMHNTHKCLLESGVKMLKKI